MTDIEITDLPNGNTRWSSAGLEAKSLGGIARLLVAAGHEGPWTAKRRSTVAMLGGSLVKLATLEGGEGIKGPPRFYKWAPFTWVQDRTP